ncbi:TraR/DksA family transcriptional regulator [Psychromonas hadalis]|uniref:TraR/DksA family transcriptional regulator n=1 Tax=Psychromonas hadalis TaxID=211669 RepID=UPI0003B64BD3|nr:RNA polymerase-binding protein DksA [Psychromonas hadalis]
MSQLNETQIAQFKIQLNRSQEQIRLAINLIFQTSDHASHHLAAKKLGRLSTDELIEFTSKIDNPNLIKNINKLKKIDASLNSIAIGMYGLCSDCESELAIEDLQLSPTTQRCPDCDVKYQKQTYNNYRL